MKPFYCILVNVNVVVKELVYANEEDHLAVQVPYFNDMFMRIFADRKYDSILDQLEFFEIFVEEIHRPREE
jgi:hypothetical protein